MTFSANSAMWNYWTMTIHPFSTYIFFNLSISTDKLDTRLQPGFQRLHFSFFSCWDGSDEKLGLGYPNGVCCGVPGLFERPDIELFSICINMTP